MKIKNEIVEILRNLATHNHAHTNLSNVGRNMTNFISVGKCLQISSNYIVDQAENKPAKIWQKLAKNVLRFAISGRESAAQPAPQLGRGGPEGSRAAAGGCERSVKIK